MIEIKKGKLYLVTGCSGTLGVPLSKEIIRRGGKVRGMARDEGKLFEFQQQIPEAEVYPGDVSNAWQAARAVKGVSGVFHCAAVKVLQWAEIHVREAVLTNVIGTQNMLEGTLIEPSVEFFVNISTDKASFVNSAYGATKFLTEKLTSQYERINPNCAYRSVKYGNILGSRSSILPRWKELIEKGKDIIVTDVNATRYFWPISEAVNLIFESLEKGVDSKPYCPEMKAMKIIDLAQAVIQKYGEGKDIKVKVTQLSEGENLHELLIPGGKFSNEVDLFTIEEILPLI